VLARLERAPEGEIQALTKELDIINAEIKEMDDSLVLLIQARSNSNKDPDPRSNRIIPKNLPAFQSSLRGNAIPVKDSFDFLRQMQNAMESGGLNPNFHWKRLIKSCVPDVHWSLLENSCLGRRLGWKEFALIFRKRFPSSEKANLVAKLGKL
jgi:hypothetical protein